MTEAASITPAELKERLDAGRVGMFFDLRNEDEFKAWRIEGRAPVPALNIPQPDFVGDEEKHFNRFPKDAPIVAVCAHGDAAKYSADLLSGQGLNVVSLAGGMDAWSELYEVNRLPDEPAIHQVFRVARGCIAYLIASRGEALVIDAGRHVERLVELASKLGVRIVRVLDTHLHADHVSGGRILADRAQATYHLNAADAGGATVRYQPLKDRERIAFGDSFVEAVHAPGHTPGSTSFLYNGRYLFTGDTIMKTGAGRPDLGGKAEAWAKLLYTTLFERFRSLGDDVVALPSHAASMREQDREKIIRITMGEARKELDLFQLRDEKAFTAFILKNLLENPDRYQDIRRVNLGTFTADEAKQKELEIGKNLCGMARQVDAAA